MVGLVYDRRQKEGNKTVLDLWKLGISYIMSTKINLLINYQLLNGVAA